MQQKHNTTTENMSSHTLMALLSLNPKRAQYLFSEVIQWSTSGICASDI